MNQKEQQFLKELEQLCIKYGIAIQPGIDTLYLYHVDPSKEYVKLYNYDDSFTLYNEPFDLY